VVPKFISPNFGIFLREHLTSSVKKLQFLFSERLGKVALGRVIVGDSKQVMSGQVRLG